MQHENATQFVICPLGAATSLCALCALSTYLQIKLAGIGV